MIRGVLFINGTLGLEILESTVMVPHYSVSAVILNESKKRSKDYKQSVESILNKHHLSTLIIETDSSIWEDDSIIKLLSESDFGVSALYGHIIPSDVLRKTNLRIMNLHPSLLPHGRGADPIPWAVINGLPQGVTLHEIDLTLDTGPIIVSEGIDSDISMDSGQIYESAVTKMLELYKKFLTNWVEGTISSQPQVGSGDYHNSNELNQIRESLESGKHDFEKAIRTFQALKFSDGRVPRIRTSDGALWEIRLELKQASEGDQEK
jgi:methionyl-tRNA formyltransferase